MIMTSKSIEPSNLKRLGAHHFAYLRSVANGLDVVACAHRYLGIEHGNQALAAHKRTVNSVRAVARRLCPKSHWRLIGLVSKSSVALPESPGLDEFVAMRGLEDWSQAELVLMYQEAYPLDVKANAKSRQRERLLKKLLELLNEVEAQQVQKPEPGDLVSDWFDDSVAKRLISAGLISLGHLQAAIHAGGRWFRTMPGVGVTKAEVIAAHLAMLLPGAPPAKPVFSLSAVAVVDRPSAQSFVPVIGCSGGSGLIVEEGLRRVGYGVSVPAPQAQRSLLDVGSDAEAVQAWIGARAGAPATVKVYEREANRLLLWLKFERHGLALGGMTVSDCGAYMAFLYDVPAHWISRTRASPGQVGWAPFKGQLQLRSYQQSIGVVKGLFAWLQAAQYLSANPWLLVNTKLRDDPAQRLLDSKAFSDQAAQEIQGFILRQASSPSRDRMLFIFRFMEAVGLRSAELLQARLGDFQLEPEGWFLQVHGKGSKNRLAVVPPVAMQALQAYLDSRGLPGIEHAEPNTPVLASTLDPAVGLGYQALYETVRSWLRKAVAASNLPARERQQLSGATTHWLRHTFGTRAIAREVPADVVQAQMGHASIQTTMSIYGRAPARRRAEILGQAFS